MKYWTLQCIKADGSGQEGFGCVCDYSPIKPNGVRPIYLKAYSYIRSGRGVLDKMLLFLVYFQPTGPHLHTILAGVPVVKAYNLPFMSKSIPGQTHAFPSSLLLFTSVYNIPGCCYSRKFWTENYTFWLKTQPLWEWMKPFRPAPFKWCRLYDLHW